MPPTLTELRKAMDAELKSKVLPVLREHLFTGSFPHLRRARDNGIDLLTFQFDRHGGGFLIEIARCAANGITTPWGKHIGPSKVSAWDVKDRQRIKPREGSGYDSWFRFDQGDVQIAALSVLRHLPRAEAWWHGRDKQEHESTSSG